MIENFKHHFVAQFHDSFGLYVYNCGFQKCTPSYSWGPALRNHHIIHFIANGKGKFICKGNEYKLSAGCGFYAPPDEVIFYQADSVEPWEYYWVGFNGVDSARLLEAAGLSEQSPCFKSENPQQLINQLLDIYNSKGSMIYNEAEMCGGLYKFLSSIIKEHNASNADRHRDTRQIDLAVKFIEHNYSLPISVNDIANSASISRSHLCRVFAQELGVTPNAYLIRYRINAACTLLRNKNISVGEAAYSSGFSDPMYFSRVFKRITGMTPREYSQKSKNFIN